MPHKFDTCLRRSFVFGSAKNQPATILEEQSRNSQLLQAFHAIN